MAHAGRGRWHLRLAKPACSIWARVAPYHMDISIPHSPERDGDAIAAPVACNQRYCNRASPAQSPRGVLARSFFSRRFHLCSQSDGREVTEGSPVSFSSGTNRLFLPPPRQGWCAGPSFWEAVGQPAAGSAPAHGGAGSRRCWQKLPPCTPMASCGAPGPFRALNPQHYKQSGKLGILVRGWAFSEPVSFAFSSFSARPQQLKLHFLFNLLTKAGHLPSKTAIWISPCPRLVSPFSTSSSSPTTPQPSNSGRFMLELLELAAVY